MVKRVNRYKMYQVDSLWELHLKGDCKELCKYCKKTPKGILAVCTWKPPVISYTKPSTRHTYRPDSGYKNQYIIEAKGRIRERAESLKYVYVRPYIEKAGMELVFLFMNPELPMPGAQKRKDGTKRSHREWAEKEGFRWFTEDTIQELFEGIGDD